MAVTCIFLRLTGYEKGKCYPITVVLDITLAALDVSGIYGTQEIFQKDSRNSGENGSEVFAGRADAAVMASGGQDLSEYDLQIKQICH